LRFSQFYITFERKETGMTLLDRRSADYQKILEARYAQQLLQRM